MFAALSLSSFPPDLHRDFVYLGLILPGALFYIHFQLSRFVDLAPLPSPDSALPVDSYVLTQKSPPRDAALGMLKAVWGTRALRRLFCSQSTGSAEHIQVRLFQSGIICIALVVINISLISQLQ